MLFTLANCHERIHTLSLEKPYQAISKLGRTGWVRRNIPNPETVAEHQISAALMVTRHFREKMQAMGLDILRIQDTLLIHDLGEWIVWDFTPHDAISPEEKRRNEEKAVREILWDNHYLMDLWLDYEDGRTHEWKLAMEIDKLQAIDKAREYEDKHGVPWLVEEFFTYSVVKKRQIYTDLLLRYASDLYENKPR